MKCSINSTASKWTFSIATFFSRSNSICWSSLSIAIDIFCDCLSARRYFARICFSVGALIVILTVCLFFCFIWFLIYSNDSKKILNAFDLCAERVLVRGVAPRVLDKQRSFYPRQPARCDCAYHVCHARGMR